MTLSGTTKPVAPMSLPAQERGLKLDLFKTVDNDITIAPCGSVD